MFAAYLESKFSDDLQAAKDVVTAETAKGERHAINEAVIDYVIENNLIVSDVSSFLNLSDVMNSTQLTIIGFNIFVHANNIANLIAGHSIYVSLYTNVKNRDFTIMLDKYPYVTLFNMALNITDTSKVLIYYTPDLELIQLYRKLYLPECADDWETHKAHANHLEDMVKLAPEQRQLSQNASRVEQIVMKLTEVHDVVIIGGFAASAMLGVKNTMPIQVISGTILENLLAELEVIFSPKQIEVKTYDMSTYVMPELRLSKTNILVGGEVVASLYNNTTYELVPFEVIGGNKIGGKYAVLCHLMIDYYSYKKNKMKSHAGACAHYITKLQKLPDQELPQYAGVYSDLGIYRRKKGTYNDFHVYTPEDARYNNGAYRIIKFKS